MDNFMLILGVILLIIRLIIGEDDPKQREKSENEKIKRTVANEHWIVRTHLFEPDEYICSVCGIVSYKPYKTCPCCKLPRRMKIEVRATWVDEIECISALEDKDW